MCKDLRWRVDRFANHLRNDFVVHHNSRRSVSWVWNNTIRVNQYTINFLHIMLRLQHKDIGKTTINCSFTISINSLLWGIATSREKTVLVLLLHLVWVFWQRLYRHPIRLTNRTKYLMPYPINDYLIVGTYSTSVKRCLLPDQWP